MLLSNIIFFCSILLSQQDTTNYLIKDINIKDSINSENILINKILNLKYIENSNKQSLSGILNGINGINLKDYGGGGGMQLISIRGSNSNQIAYIYDGFKLNDKNNGAFNSSLFNLNNISNIAVQNIGNSSKYGSNSLFGSLILNSKIPSCYNFKLDIASFDNYKSNASIPFKNNFALDFSIHKNRALYPIKLNNKFYTRSNSELINYNINISKIFISDSGYHNIKYLINYQSQGVPGAVVQDKLENTKAKLLSNNNYIFYNNYFKYNGYQIKSGIYINYSELNYKDTLNKITNSNGINNNFFTNNFQTYFEIKKTFINSYIEVRLDNDFTNLESDAYYKNKKGNIFGLSANYYFNINNLNFYFASRYDIISYTSNNISGTALVNYKSKYYEPSLSIARSFRAPSFNEMYYLNYGNNNLIPEISNTINFNNKIKINNIELNVNPYYSLIDNYIISIPISPVLWSAQNLEEVNNYGIENNINYELNNFKINFNYTYQKSIFVGKGILKNTNIPYMPNEIISLFAEYKNNIVNIYSDIIYNSFRYYNQGNDANSIIHPFTLLNINFNKEINIFNNILLINLAINNILNTNYQYVRNYPMPGINYNLSLNYRINK